MSGRENSPSRSRSRTRSPSPRKRSVERAFDKDNKSRSRSRSRTRSYSRDRDRRRRSYRSRTRSRSRRRYSRYSRSRSRSRDRYDRYDRDRYHSRYSRSPMSNRKRHRGSRDNPKTSKCLGVFGLSLHTQERELREFIEKYGPTDEIQIVYDHQSGRSRGFAFVYMKNLDDAIEFQEKGPGTEIDGHKIRVDFSITERAHTPTPGIYFGKPTSRGYRGDRGGDRGGYHSRRSPSPYYSRRSRYSRSRSRSYSPRRY